MSPYLSTKSLRHPSHHKMKRSLFIPTICCALMLGTLPAYATESTKEFVKDAAIGNRFEIKSSQMALEKSQDDEVKKFAQHMIDDHSRANESLKTSVSAATDADVQMPTDKLDSKHQKLLKKLGDKTGKDFDKLYIDDQLDAHNQTVKMFENYAEDGDNETIKKFASDTLPTLQQHQQDIKKIKSLED